MESNTNQFKKYFEELAKIRISNLEKIQKKSLKNAPINIVYELIQNADNAQATYATFELYKNNLIFKHNGKKHFTISNPATEEEDLKNNKLGDVNSITLIANFNQTEPKIGNIGYGIKSVFEYTKSISIYDPNFCFKIEQYVVPSLLTEDYNGRQNDETIIDFPLNLSVFNKISSQLKNMNHPNLFLKTITNITYTIENQITDKIVRKIEIEMNLADIKVQYISLIHQNGDSQSLQKFWVFTRLIKSYPISIAFLTSDDGFLKPLPQTYAYCFFQTSEMSYLNFLINAPFLLTNERTKIKPDEPHNQLMIAELASLSAKSLTIFKDIGQKYDIKLINDSVLSIFPTIKDSYNNKNKISFSPFVDEVQKVFLSEEIIPTEKGFTSTKNAYWTPDSALLDLINNEQLTVLVNNPNAKWVFRTLNGKKGKQPFDFICSIVQTEICDYILFNSEKTSYRYYSSSSTNNALSQDSLPNFIDCFDPTSTDENLNPFASCELKVTAYLTANSTSKSWGKKGAKSGSLKWSSSDLKICQPFENTNNLNPKENDQNKRAFKGISPDFIEKQSFEWLNSFYKWICLSGSRISMAKTMPIFLDQNKKAVAAFDPQNKNLKLFFPVIHKADQNYVTVNSTLF